MKQLELPLPVAEALREIQDTTRALVEATRNADAGAILDAMQRRGRAVDQLGRALNSTEGRTLDPEDRADLLETIFHESLEADSRLGEMQNWLRDELRVVPPLEDAPEEPLEHSAGVDTGRRSGDH